MKAFFQCGGAAKIWKQILFRPEFAPVYFNGWELRKMAVKIALPWTTDGARRAKSCLCYDMSAQETWLDTKSTARLRTGTPLTRTRMRRSEQSRR